MPSDSRITAFHRDMLLAVVALTLLVAPLWVPAINIGDPTYTYERAQIVLDDEDGITYANETENDAGLYRLDLALEPASPADVLRAVSRDVSAEHVDVAPVVVEAAKEGEATSHHEVEVPQTPMRLDDGTYYRVYTAESSDVAPMAQFLRIVLPIAGPLIGLFIVFRLFQRIEVTYVGDKRGL